MQFNTYEFLVFFVVIYGLYFCLKHPWQNKLLLVASYVFYGWWDWRFLSLIFISTLTDYLCGIQIYNQQSRERKRI